MESTTNVDFSFSSSSSAPSSSPSSPSSSSSSSWPSTPSSSSSSDVFTPAVANKTVKTPRGIRNFLNHGKAKTGSQQKHRRGAPKPSAADLNPKEDLSVVAAGRIRCMWGGCQYVSEDPTLFYAHFNATHRDPLIAKSKRGDRWPCLWPAEDGSPCTRDLLHQAPWRRHIDTVHLLVGKRQCIHCGVQKRDDSYLVEHGLARNCMMSPTYQITDITLVPPHQHDADFAVPTVPDAPITLASPAVPVALVAPIVPTATARFSFPPGPIGATFFAPGFDQGQTSTMLQSYVPLQLPFPLSGPQAFPQYLPIPSAPIPDPVYGTGLLEPYMTAPVLQPGSFADSMFAALDYYGPVDFGPAVDMGPQPDPLAGIWGPPSVESPVSPPPAYPSQEAQGYDEGLFESMTIDFSQDIFVAPRSSFGNCFTPGLDDFVLGSNWEHPNF